MANQLDLMIDGRKVAIRGASQDEIVDLRHRVLRANLPRIEAIFPGDGLPTSSHFAAVTESGEVIGCATFHLNIWQNRPAFQLRGMATDPVWAGKGVGKAVLGYAVQSIQQISPIRLLWCNARLIAVPFYEKLGWTIVSDRFDIPTAGPHHRMVRDLRK